MKTVYQDGRPKLTRIDVGFAHAYQFGPDHRLYKIGFDSDGKEIWYRCQNDAEALKELNKVIDQLKLIRLKIKMRGQP
jgi:hypothetical protein